MSHLLAPLCHQGCWLWSVTFGLGSSSLPGETPAGGRGVRAELGLCTLPCSSMLILLSASCMYKNVTCELLKDLGGISSSNMQILQSVFSFAEIGLGHVLRLSYKFSS